MDANLQMLTKRRPTGLASLLSKALLLYCLFWKGRRKGMQQILCMPTKPSACRLHFTVLLQDKHACPAALLDVYPSPCRSGPFAPWLLLVSAPVATPRKAAAERWTAPEFHQCCLPNPLLGL